jgi:biopolymer transport protein TolR
MNQLSIGQIAQRGTNMKTATKSTPFINVTPLIDVLLVLLIIFMVVSPSKSARFKALVPEPPNDQDLKSTPSDLNLRVDLNADGELALNSLPEGSISDTAVLTRALSNLFTERTRLGTVDPVSGKPATTVYIKAPRNVPYGKVASVIDSVKTAGGAPIGLQIDKLND